MQLSESEQKLWISGSIGLHIDKIKNNYKYTGHQEKTTREITIQTTSILSIINKL